MVAVVWLEVSAELLNPVVALLGGLGWGNRDDGGPIGGD